MQKKYSFLTEGFKLKTYFADASGGNLAREASNTEKILTKYPTSQDLIKALKRLQEDGRCNEQCYDKFSQCIGRLENKKYENPDSYREFVRKNLSGASGFWKYVAYGLANGMTGGLWTILYNIYKVHRVEDQINNDTADDALLKMNSKTFFR